MFWLVSCDSRFTIPKLPTIEKNILVFIILLLFSSKMMKLMVQIDQYYNKRFVVTFMFIGKLEFFI